MTDQPARASAPAVVLIAAERLRQVTEEGWTPEHDDEHDTGELADAAGCYALVAAAQSRAVLTDPTGMPAQWPWSRDWWKPSDDRIRNLVKAGALIAAEIDVRTRRSEVPDPARASAPTKAARLPRECARDDGRPKFRFETRAEAKDAARRHNVGERVYRCRHCSYFHLASTSVEGSCHTPAR